MKEADVVEEANKKLQRELNSGAIALVVLGLLESVDEPMYGYLIAKRLEGTAHASLPMHQAALYPVLRSLEKQNLVVSHMEPSAEGPARKYYALSSAGRKTMQAWRETWTNTKHFVDSILECENEHKSSKASKGRDRRVSKPS